MSDTHETAEQHNRPLTGQVTVTAVLTGLDDLKRDLAKLQDLSTAERSYTTALLAKRTRERDTARQALRDLVDATNWREGCGIVVSEAAMNTAMRYIVEWFRA